MAALLRALFLVFGPAIDVDAETLELLMIFAGVGLVLSLFLALAGVVPAIEPG
jgi:hypothetical protein